MDSITISNEFASVTIRRVFTRNGARLEMTSPKRGTQVQLDATVLEALTWQTPESLSLLLETPFEPFHRQPPA